MAKLIDTVSPTVPTRTIEVGSVGSEVRFPVGIRLLSMAENAGVVQRAKAKAKDHGVAVWSDTDPNCALELWVEKVAACTFDVDGAPGAFEPWATAEQLRQDRSLGQENLLFIFECYEAFEQENSIRPEDLQGATFVSTILRASGGDLRPLERMRRTTLMALVASLAGQLLNSTSVKSPNTSDSGSTAGATPQASSDA